jgi:hypothetical protein
MFNSPITIMPYAQEKRDLRYTVNFFVIAVFFLSVVFLTPDAGSRAGRSFFDGAMATNWRVMGDWLAAWCSIKIMLYSMAGLFLLLSIEETLLFFRRHKVANLLILTLIVPMVGFGMGFYYLVKSVL